MSETSMDQDPEPATLQNRTDVHGWPPETYVDNGEIHHMVEVYDWAWAFSQALKSIAYRDKKECGAYLFSVLRDEDSLTAWKTLVRVGLSDGARDGLIFKWLQDSDWLGCMGLNHLIENFEKTIDTP